MQHGLNGVAADPGVRQLGAGPNKRLGARWIVPFGIAEIERAPLAAFERRSAVLVADLEICSARNQKLDGIDVAAQRGMPDRRETFPTARVHIEAEFQHQLDGGDVVRKRRRPHERLIVGIQFRQQIRVGSKDLRRMRFISKLARGEELLFDRTAREKEIVDVAAAVPGRDQQGGSGLELPLVDMTGRHWRIPRATDARREAAWIGVYGPLDQRLIAKRRCHEDVDLGTTRDEIAAQVGIADPVLSRRRSMIDTSSVDLRAMREQDVDDFRCARPVQRSLAITPWRVSE